MASRFETESDQLRKEIQFLKDCQVKYFALSVTAAGAIAGFADKSKPLPGGCSVYLAPLLVIIPCWWIFFDKGTTISRIVAYLRLLETSIKNGAREAKHVGWENALEIYRRDEANRPWKTKLAQYVCGIWYGLRYTLPLATTHKYWSINWWTFACLSGAACTFAWLDPPAGNSGVRVFAIAVSVFSAVHNLSVVGRLTKGAYSYQASHERWITILPRHF